MFTTPFTVDQPLDYRPPRFTSLKTVYACPLYSPSTGHWRGSLATVDATPMPVTLYTPTATQANAVKFRAVALQTDGTKAATWEISASFRCDASGVLALVGTATSVAVAADAGFAPTAALSASGANIIATLTGIAATNIAWTFEAEIA